MSDYTKEIFKNEKRGFTKYPWYLTYYSMMVRCYREGSYNYKNYGARGISVCEEWHDISKFKEWVDNSDYKIGYSLDRIDVNGNYEPSNCRWANKKVQANNRRDNVIITHNGESHTIAEWSEITGIDRTTLVRRFKLGYSEEDIFYNGKFYYNQRTKRKEKLEVCQMGII